MPSLPALSRCGRALFQRYLRDVERVDARWHLHHGGTSYQLVSKLCPVSYPKPTLKRFASTAAAIRSSCHEGETTLESREHRLDQSPIESIPSATLPCGWIPHHNRPNRGRPNLGTRRGRKALRLSPSKHVINALGEYGWQFVTPSRYAYKLDLSYNNPKYSSNIRRRRKGISRPALEHGATHISLQAILARYISASWSGRTKDNSSATYTLPMAPLTNEAGFHTFPEAELTVLRSKGYEASDVQLWASLITSEDLVGSLRQFSLSGDSVGLTRRQLPTFVFLLLLRRRHITISALSILLSYAQRLFQASESQGKGEKSEKFPAGGPQPGTTAFPSLSAPTSAVPIRDQMDDTTAMIIVVRLMRHARRVWPRALLHIASLLTTHVDRQDVPDSLTAWGAKSSRRLSYLAFICNRVLSLLSLRASLYPLRTINDHERAQFHVLRLMAEHRPPLVVTQEGFRAVIGTQLARRKTAHEREWAELKSTSWPPWKEAKTGMDVEKGVELGWSGAILAMRRMQEAGYGMGLWDMAAKVLAGWNTDDSPTIQTRSLLSSLPLPSLQEVVDDSSDALAIGNKHHQIWAARIRATRTLEEAWACFLQFKDCGSNPAQGVYVAMFEKLAFDSKRRRQAATASNSQDYMSHPLVGQVIPGDGKEVLPAPTDPHEAVYIASAPPTMEQLFDHMVEDNIQPSGHCLETLVRHATSFRLGLKYIRASAIAHDASIFSHFSRSSEDLGKLTRISDQMFTAFIKLLCRFPESMVSSTVHDPKKSKIINEWRSGAQSRLVRAFDLVNARKPQFRPIWNVLLQAFAREDQAITLLSPETDSSVNAMLCFRMMQDIRRCMRDLDLDMDAEGFQWICTGLANATLASLKVKDLSIEDFEWSTPLGASHREGQRRTAVSTFNAANEAQSILSGGALLIKRLFQNLVGVAVHITYKKKDSCLVPLLSQLDDGTRRALPRLLVVPAPAQLHAYVRALGFLDDYYGINQLLVWMIEYKDELQVIVNELHNGRRTMRFTHVAMRVFLEQSWESRHSFDRGRRKVVRDAEDLMNGVEEWGGWPSDEEVEKYCRKGRIHELLAASQEVGRG